MPKTKRLLACTAASVLIGAGSIVATVLPAQAGTSSRICYSSDSTDHHSVRVYDSVPGGWWYTVQYGNCSPWISLTGALVNTCPENNNISYYQYKYPGGSYGTKHYGCNASSNPTNVDGSIYIKIMN